MVRRYLFSIFLFLYSFTLPALAHAESSALTRVTDYNGDGNGDIIMYDPTTTQFQIRYGGKTGTTSLKLGKLGDLPTFGDFNGDGAADVATFNPSRSYWNIRYGTKSKVSTWTFGKRGSIPVPGFYRQNVCTEIATYHRETAEWQIDRCPTSQYSPQIQVSASYIFKNQQGALPVPADYDCDGLTDRAVFNRRTNTWVIKRSANGKIRTFRFGKFGDVPVPGDYDGNGCAEAAIYRPSTNQLITRNGTTGHAAIVKHWGKEGDWASVFNTDGGKDEIAVFRPESATLYTSNASTKVLAVSFPSVSQRVGTTAPSVSALSLGDIIGSIIGGIGGATSGGAGNVGGISIPGIGGSDFTSTPEVFPTEVFPASHSGPVVLGGSHRTRTIGDYSRLGQSDLTLVRTMNNELIWSIYHNDSSSSLYRFGFGDDQIVAGDYNGDERTDPAVVREEGGQLNWYTRKAGGQVKLTSFGLAGDRALTGDFDCDGKNDKVVVRAEADGLLHWYARLSTQATEVPRTTVFGLPTDYVFAADVLGTGCDQYVVAQNVGGMLWWFVQKASGGAVRGPVQWGLASDEPLTPIDFDGDGTSDFIVVRNVGNQKTAYVRSYYSQNPVGVPDQQFVFGNRGDFSFGGFFSGVNRAEFGVYRQGSQTNDASSFYILKYDGTTAEYPLGVGRDRVVRPDGTVGGFDQMAKRIFASCSKPRFPDGSGGALWKPEADGANHGKPTFLASPALQSVKLYAADGSFITNVRLRYSFGPGGRSVWDVPYSGSDLLRYAPITIKADYPNGECEIRTVPDPRSRVD